MFLEENKGKSLEIVIHKKTSKATVKGICLLYSLRDGKDRVMLNRMMMFRSGISSRCSSANRSVSIPTRYLIEMHVCACVCVQTCVGERERARVCVYVCVFATSVGACVFASAWIRVVQLSPFHSSTTIVMFPRSPAATPFNKVRKG